MLFVRVNEYTIRCTIEENELDQMGYNIDELYKNQDTASNFMKNVMEKGKEAGFQIAGSFQAVQAAVMPDRKLILNFVDVNPDVQIDLTITNFLTAHEAVEIVGKNRLEDILKLTGQEKAYAFQKCMVDYQNTINQDSVKRSENLEENQFERNVTAHEEEVIGAGNEVSRQAEGEKGILKNARYVIRFQNFGDLSKFTKELSFQTNISLYKEKSAYYLIADLEGLDEKAQNNLIFHAKEYAADYQKNTSFESFLQEHGKLLLNKTKLDVLQQL